MTVANESLSTCSVEKELSLVLRRDAGGPELLALPIGSADLADLRAILWRDGCLRRGQPALPLEQAPIEALGLVQDEAVVGIRFLVAQAGGVVFSRTFDVHSFAHVARRGATLLLAASVLKPGDAYQYELERRPRALGTPTAQQARGVRIRRKPAKRPFVGGVDRAALVQQSTAVGTLSAAFPVFIVQEVLARAESISRQGVQLQPPRETGVMLAGVRAGCRDGEMAVIVLDALELLDAQANEFELRPTPQTYSRLDAELQALRQRPGFEAVNFVGQSHGHPFLPGRSEETDCTSCPQRATCCISSAVPSSHDLNYMKSVFHDIPWALCMIFGYDARGNPVSDLFSLDEQGQWAARGYYVLPSFDFPGAAT